MKNNLNLALWLSVMLLFVSGITHGQTSSTLNQDNKTDKKADKFIDSGVKCLDDIKKLDNFVSRFDPTTPKEMPVGLAQQFGSVLVTVAFSDRKDTLDHYEFSVFCKVDIPQGKTLYFGAQHVKYSHSGGLTGDATLMLLGDVDIPFEGGKTVLTLKGAEQANMPNPQSLTYAKLTCDGISEIGLSAEVSFSRDMLIPLNADYTPIADTNQKVKAAFKTVVTDWNDILAEISLSPFEVSGVKDFAFVVDKAVFDFSDTRNSSSVIFPQNYANVVPGNEKLWRGVYANLIKVVLPKEFAGKDTTQRTSFMAENLIIDNSGISGTFAGNDILKKGNASGWGFSVDKAYLSLNSGHMTECGFNGKIQIPVSKGKNTGYAYKGLIDDEGNYLMNVASMDTIDFNVFAAKAYIFPGSYIDINVVNHRFCPKAVLNGVMTISATKQTAGDKDNPNEKPLLSVKNIEFQELTLNSVRPYFGVKYCGYKGDVSLGGFPVTLSDIGMAANGDEIWLGFGVKVNLMENKFSGQTHLKIIGGIRDTDGEQAYVFKKVEIDDVSINANFPKMTLAGAVRFNRNDPVMGSGFQGNLKMTLNLGKSFDVEAAAAFGSKAYADNAEKSYRYWCVDALASGFTVPVFSGISLNGFCGGASYHMKRAVPGSASGSPTANMLSFVPDDKTGMSFRAAVMFYVGSEKSCKGEAGLEMVFSNSWGLLNAGLFGKAYIMPSDNLLGKLNPAGLKAKMQKSLTGLTQNMTGINEASFNKNALSGKFTDMAKTYPTETKIEEKGSITALAGFNFDFQNNSLDGNLDVYVSLLDGTIRGIGPDNNAGWARMHFSQEKWYVYIGTPENRIGLQMGIGDIAARADSYVMMGSKIPGSPAPPAEVASLLKVSQSELDYMGDLNALGEGKGFAFGSSFSVKTGNLAFLMFYANFSAGMGFDFMLKNYGNAHCVGSSEPIGVNGWFANGQAYAYFQGDIGIRVKLFMVKKNISILNIAAATLLQAKFPNPSWFRGYVGGRFSALGGLVKGECNFKVTLGQECEIASGSSALDGINIISDFAPADQEKEVDVFVSPKAVFNMAVNKPFKVENENGSSSYYRINLDNYTILANGKPVAGKLKWNDKGDAVEFESDEILPPQTELKAEVKVSFEEQKNSRWTAVYENGQRAVQTKTVTFKTGSAPENIPLSNIALMYPVLGQKYYYQAESNRSFIQLKRGQAYLFTNALYKHKLSLTNGKQTEEAAFTYNEAEKSVMISMPTLKTSSEYELALWGIPVGGSDGVNRQSSTVASAEGNSISIAENKANGVSSSDKPRNYLTYKFSTSKYNSLSEKIEAKKTVKTHYEIITGDVGALHAEVTSGEAFDAVELLGNAFTGNKPLLYAEAIPDDEWFTSDINPLIYSGYSQMGGIALSRDTAIAGVPPVRTMEILTWYTNYLASSPNDQSLSTYMPYRYNAASYYNKDFRELQNKIANTYIKQPSAINNRALRIMTSAFPRMRGGNYRALYKYVLPDGKAGSSQKTILTNPVM
ncbi:MAG: hypothetical protein H6Q20_2068 [Bacteroidetes bacterium]|nr:hypothetical protein [Bacteroidota bacterium]